MNATLIKHRVQNPRHVTKPSTHAQMGPAGLIARVGDVAGRQLLYGYRERVHVT